MELAFDRLPIDHKPDEKEFGYRVLNMVSLKTNYLDQLIYAISHFGYAYKDAAVKGTKQIDFISQEWLTLDFDDGTTIDTVEKKCEEYKLLPMFIYYTFSHTEEHPRFRVVFHLNEVVKDLRLAKTLRFAINELFPEADQIKNVTQIYQGSTKGEYGFNINHLISPHDVILKACEKIKREVSKAHYARTMQRRLFINTRPKLTRKVGNSYSYIIEPDGKSGEFWEYDFVNVNFSEESTVRNDEAYDWKFLEENCKLWRDATSGEHWINYNEFFFFASSLKGKKGSSVRLKKLIKKAVELHPYNYNSAKIENLNNAIKNAAALYRRCDRLPCPYQDKCKFNTLAHCQPIKRGYVQKIRQNRYISLEEGERLLREAIADAFTNDERINIIKAQTGIGKTTALLEYLQRHKDLSVCLAVPTHKLKNEVAEKIKQYGLDFDVIPELDIDLLEAGEREQYLKRLKVGDYGGCQKTLAASQKPEIMEYVRLTDNFNRGWLGNVIITHKRTFLKSRIPNDVLVVDEDIFLNSFESVTVSMDDLRRLEHVAKSDILNIWFEKISGGSGLLKIWPIGKKNVREIIHSVKNDINFNVHQVLRSRLCFIDNEHITFVIRNDLPRCEKIIILSATIDDALSRYLTYPIKTHFVEIPRVELEGELFQYIDLPSSRQALEDGCGVLDNYKKIGGVMPEENMPIITFKKYENELLKHGFNVVGTFGSTEGLNSLEGLNIAVVGTYRTREIQYLLFAKLLDDTIEVRDLKTSNSIVEYNGYRFKLYTFEHPIVRQVQLYMINSELEQCVGRARLLRNNNQVHLVAKLPLEDATIKNLM